MASPSTFSEKDKRGIAVLIGVVVVVVALAGIRLALTRDTIVDQYGCVGAPRRATAIVIDRSEAISTQTLQAIRDRALSFIRDSTAENELVSVFEVTDTARRSLAPKLARCRPPDSGNRLTQHVESIKKQFQNTFEVPLQEALGDAPETGRESAIASTLIDISLNQHLRGSERNTLLVFSDLLENTPEFSLYGCSNPGDVIERFRSSRVGAVERPTFRNTRVYLHVIPRLRQTRAALQCRDRLWVWFFGDNAGTYAGVELDYLPGGETPPPVLQSIVP